MKNEAELEGIRRAQGAAEAAMGAARDLMRAAERSNGSLSVDGEPLTCELLKVAIRRVFTEHGVASDDFIVSHGAQTAIGHELGFGEIAPDEPIVIDLWPKDPESGCYADMTRTFVVGTPPDELVEYHRLVKEALDRSLEATKAGVPGVEIYELVCEFFEENGQPTVLSKPPGEVLENGFFHGLGHGVGLEVHEQPNLGRGGTGGARRRRRRHARAGSLSPGLRRLPARGSRPRHRGRRREPHGFSVRPDALSSDGTGAAIETMFLEERRYPPPEDFAAQANAQPDIYERDFEEFWETEGASGSPGSSRSPSCYEWEPPYAKWYLGGKLNVCFNCVDRHVEAGNGEKVAYYWEGEPEDERRTITFSDLQREVVKLANALKTLGVTKGTPVGIYMGMVPEVPVAMLACARLGAPHTVVFGGFSADSLSGRLNDMGCEVLITQDEAWRKGSPVPLKRNADEALADAPGVKRAVVLRRTGNDVPMQEGRDVWWHELVADGERRRRVLSVRADGRRGSALPALHERHDGEAEGDRAHDRRLPRRRGDDAPLHLRRQARLGVLVRGRRRLGDRPQLHRLRAALQRDDRASCTRACRTTRTATAGGRSSSATRSTSSTRRRPRSART